MPTSHTSEVTKDKAILLHAIWRGISIDVGAIIMPSILHSLSKYITIRLVCPYLVFGLYKKAGVAWTSDEEI